MIRLRFAGAFLLTALVIPMGCGKNPDATGEAGIGAPGKVDPNVPVLSDDEMYKAQLKQEAEIQKASRSK